MGVCYYLVNRKTKETFELNKFSPAPAVKWDQLDKEPEKLAFDIHKEYLNVGNPNFDYQWCLSLVSYMRLCFTNRTGFEILTEMPDDPMEAAAYTLVGTRFDSFKGQS